MWDLEQSGMTLWFWLSFHSTSLLGTWGKGKRKMDRKVEGRGLYACVQVCNFSDWLPESLTQIFFTMFMFPI